jgi:RNA polymerase sigma-70 factor, ECF subfamily
MTIKAANPVSIDDLVQAYFPAVVHLALSILDDGHCNNIIDEAEDAAQETFIAASRALENFRGESAPKTWLFAIAINICRSHIRRRNGRRWMAKAVELFEQRASSGEDLQSRVEIRERDVWLWKEIDHLDGKHRLVVVLYYVHEFPVKEIAQVLGINEGTVHSRLFHARHQLAGRLKQSQVWEEAANR